MTYQSDPTRWTQSPGEVPELLRGGFEAARREGPSDLQMRALALKLAAVGTGAAVAAGTVAGAKAASTTAAGTGLAAASGGSALSLAKIAVTAVLIGAAASGGTIFMRRLTSEDQPAPVQIVTPQGVHEQTESAAALDAPAAAPFAAPVARTQAPVNTPTAERAPVEAVVPSQGAPSQIAPAQAMPSQAASKPSVHEPIEPSAAPVQAVKAERRERRAQVSEASSVAPVSRANNRAPAVENVAGNKSQPSEIDLLSKARAALAARPREAYRLTEEHKALYPQGMFGQERDALAVEALQRAGDLKHARALAEVFVQRYPSSPHAHRFRETMNIP